MVTVLATFPQKLGKLFLYLPVTLGWKTLTAKNTLAYLQNGIWTFKLSVCCKYFGLFSTWWLFWLLFPKKMGKLFLYLPVTLGWKTLTAKNTLAYLRNGIWTFKLSVCCKYFGLFSTWWLFWLLFPKKLGKLFLYLPVTLGWKTLTAKNTLAYLRNGIQYCLVQAENALPSSGRGRSTIPSFSFFFWKKNFTQRIISSVSIFFSQFYLNWTQFSKTFEGIIYAIISLFTT